MYNAAIAAILNKSFCQILLFVDFVETNDYIFKIFSPLGSHTILVFPHQTAWRYSDGDTPDEGVECRQVRQNRDSGRISGYRLMTGGVRTTTCDRPLCSLPHRRPRISEFLFITTSMDDHDEDKRTEQNLFIRSGINMKRK